MALTLEYGGRGLVGIMTPQANSTVEPEMALLLGPELGLLTARLTSSAPDLRARLIDYLDWIDATLASFAGAPLRLVGFACTGSSYLMSSEAEQARLAALTVPVVTAAVAVRRALDELGARKVALVSPYPSWLTEACVGHWRRVGYDVLDVVAPESQGGHHAIYTTRGRAVLDAARRAAALRPDAIILAGTGMPTLAAVARLDGPPAVSSNMSLAWMIERELGGPMAFSGWLAPGAPWRARLADRFPAAFSLA